MVFLTIPNIISFVRVVLTPLIVVLLMQQSFFSLVCSLILFTLAAVTDFYDGYFARRLKKITDLGAFIDPLADKIFTLTMFGVFTYLGVIHPLIFSIFFIRDIFLTALRSIIIAHGFRWTTSYLAKVKTALQFIVLYGAYLILFVRKGVGFFPIARYECIYGFVVAIISFIAVYSAIDYLFCYAQSVESIINSYKLKPAVDTGIVWGATLGCARVRVSAPGTVASFFALMIAYFLGLHAYSSHVLALVALFIFFVFGWLVASRAEFLLKIKDPGVIVIDEFFAMILVCLFLPKSSFIWYVAGFILFRLFDIFKPYPINFLERRIKGGLGIMVDDIAAAFFSLIFLYVILGALSL